MGIFSNKTKKKQNSFENQTNEQKVLQILSSVVENSEIKGDKLYISKIALTIDVYVPNVREQTVQVIFQVSHAMLDEPIVESTAGVGKNVDDAFVNAVASFAFSVLCAITNSIQETEGVEVTATYAEQKNAFTLYESCKTTMGKENIGRNISLWGMLQEKLLSALGNRKIYWIKVFASSVGNAPSCEVRINGTCYDELTDIIEQYVASWADRETFHAEKQYFMLIQSEQTYLPYPLTKSQIMERTKKAIDLFSMCVGEEDYAMLPERLLASIGNRSLSHELYAFIPEILCQLVFSDVTYQNKIGYYKGKDEPINLYSEQLYTYPYIREVIEKFWDSPAATKEIVINIISCSATYKTLSQALHNGSKLEDMVLTGIGFMPPDDYVLR